MRRDCKKLIFMESYVNDNKIRHFSNKDLPMLLVIVPGIENFIKRNINLNNAEFSDKLDNFVVKWITRISDKCNY